MNSNDKFIAVTSEGKIERISLIREEVTISDSVIAAMTRNVNRKINSVFAASNGSVVHMCVTGTSEIYYSMRLNKLPLKAPYKMEKGELYPMFRSKEETVISIDWEPPKDMILIMIIHASGDNTSAQNQWLFAKDSEGRLWRLPLGNSYPDGRLCQGTFDKYGNSGVELVEKELAQLANGKWNGDLDTNAVETKKMFRFKPDNEKFKQLPPDGKWQSLCTKISPPVYNFCAI